MISSDKIWEHDPQLRDALEKIMVCAECALLQGPLSLRNALREIEGIATKAINGE